MAFKFVLLVLPALVLANINVTLSGTFDGDASHLYTSCTGQDVGLITNTERNSFGLNDYDLKHAVGLFAGKDPDDAFLRRPTPWNDLYRRFVKTEVTRTLKPKKCNILKKFSKPITVMQQVLENNSTKRATIDIRIFHSLYNKLALTWSTNRLLSIEDEINYDIKIADKSGEITYFHKASAWNKNTQWTQPVTVGVPSFMNFTLQPGQAVVAHLQITRQSIQLQVEYEARLTGYTAVYYYYKYQGHHFYAIPITKIMAKARISNQLMSREFIDIEFYSEPKVIFTDRDRGYKLKEVSF